MDTRPAKFAESQTVIDWLLVGKEKNHCDLGVLDYPTIEVWATGHGEQVDCFTPIHSGLIVESLALRPEADAKERFVAAVAGIVKASERAQQFGIRELYYMSSDDRTDEAAKNLGFEEVKMFRKKLK